MRSHVKVSHWVFLLTFYFISYTAYTQPGCSCAEYSRLKAEYDQRHEGITGYIQKLQASGNVICRAKSYEWQARDYLDKNNFDSAEIYFQLAEKWYRQSGCGDSVLLSNYKYWTQLHYTKGDFVKAQESTFKLLRSAEASGSAYEEAGTYTMIAQLFNQTAQADKGIVYTRMALPFLDRIEQPAKLIDILFKLSKRYLWHYQDTKILSSLDSSELFSLRQLSIAKQSNNRVSTAAAFSNLEGIEWERKNYNKALQFLDSSFKYTDSSQYGTLSTNYYDKADLLIELKRYVEAEKMADSSMYYYRFTQNLPYIAEAYELLSRIAEAKGDYKKAFETNELARAITDSIRNTEKAKQVTELERKYTQAKNEQTIKELAQQKQIYLLLAVAGLLAAIAIGFFLRQQSLRHKQKILETEQRLNRARMNPHFFFNTLASFQSFILREQDSQKLTANLSRFSHIMRETLESTYKEYATIEQEIDFLKEYLELQQMRFPGKFSFEIKAGDNVEIDELVIPAMIIQPFVENSIEHGFAGSNEHGDIRIEFSEEKKELLIEIHDNGKGLVPVKENNGHISRASQIIRDRIYLLNSKRKTKAGFSIDNHANGKGVVVKIHLPLIGRNEITIDR